MWDALLPSSVTCYVHEDNSGYISGICSGKNPIMKYLSRTQGINIQMLHEFIGQENKDCPCLLVKTASEHVVVDIHIVWIMHAALPM